MTIGFALYPSPTRTQSIEKLVMPGELILDHAELEDDCSNCHRPFQRQLQRTLCLDCHDHENVKTDIATSSGFHGRVVVPDQECSACHTDHKGRDADVVGLDPQVFDHARTDYELHGLHRSVACDGCHEPDKARRDAPHECISCHREDDAHSDALGEDCASCHRETGWKKQTDFDHDKTKFPLVGKHRDVACAACHTQDSYEDTPSECSSCHGVNDVHDGNFGSDCARCHSSKGWDRIRFDHARDTEFPLRGAHRSQKCQSCHTQNLEAKLEKTCVSCHAADDQHKGRFGSDCAACHGTERWVDEKFDHGTTDFPLRGKHGKVSCESCHTGVVGEAKLEIGCQACHSGSDVHLGQQGEECQTCHSESGWAAAVRFDHGLTTFPLLGLHGVVTCEECHTTKAFQDTESACSECHRSDDFHEATLGQDCRRCHNPNGWNFWKFDHSKQTEFELTGAHEGLDCRSCHVTEVTGEVEQSQECGVCHAADDTHLGSYGDDCGRCHTTRAWRQVRPGP